MKKKSYSTLESGLMRMSESCQVARDKVCLGAMWVDLPTRMGAWLPGSLDTVPRALGAVRHPGRRLLLTTFRRQAPSIPPAPPGVSAPTFDPADIRGAKSSGNGPKKESTSVKSKQESKNGTILGFTQVLA